MYSATLLSLEVKVKVWKVSGGIADVQVFDIFTFSII